MSANKARNPDGFAAGSLGRYTVQEAAWRQI